VDLATCARPPGISDVPTSIRVRITDQVPADWQFNLAQGRCAVTLGHGAGAPLTVSASAQAWQDLAAKRLSFAGAYLKGSVQAEGDTGLLMRLDDAFSGPVDPTRRAEVSPEQDQDRATSAPPGQGVGPATEVRQSEDGSTTSATPAISPSTGGVTAGDVRAAMLTALTGLPPGASREQQQAAIHSALTLRTPPGGLPAGAFPLHESGTIRIALALRQVLAALPPNATAAQRSEAIRAALGQAAGDAGRSGSLGAGVPGQISSGHH
jgi:hypothetical protein